MKQMADTKVRPVETIWEIAYALGSFDVNLRGGIDRK